MLISDVVTAVRAITGHDSDTQFSDSTQLLPVLAQEYRQLRQWLCVHVPNLCETSIQAAVTVVGSTYYVTPTVAGVVGSPVAMANSNTIPKSICTDFERLRKWERLQANGTWYPIIVHDDLNWSQSRDLCVHEQGDTFVLNPPSAALITHQITFLTGAPATITTGTTVNLPAGLADVMINRAAEWVSIRHDPGQAAYFANRADKIMSKQGAMLKQRYGAMNSPGMVQTRA